MLGKITDRKNDPTPRSTAKAIANMDFSDVTEKIKESFNEDQEKRQKKVELM